MTFPKPNWYVGCSPRDPRKLVPELRLLLKYQGKRWAVKEQENFAKELSTLSSFEGEGYGKELAFSARDRVAKLKTYGFVYVSDDNILCITPAGKWICETHLPEEVFLKQMLKWQFPSYQHRENQYPAEKFLIRPFIFVSKLIEALDGISKTELAIFAFITTKEDETNEVIEKVKKYRKAREVIKGKTKKGEFDYQIHYQLIKRAFSEFIKQGKTNLRESGRQKFSEEDFLDTKIGSSYDMADALVRHLRFTPLFTIQGNRVIIADNMHNIVRKINSKPIRINPDYDNVEKFYNYMGNPDLPVTIIDKKEGLVREIRKLLSEVQIRHKEAQKINHGISAPPIVAIENLSAHNLKEYLFSLLEFDKNYKRTLLERKIQESTMLTEIISTYQQIVDREVIDAPAYFEWNTWRALLHLDDEERIIPNFSLDKDLKPLNSAGGRKGDIETYYPEAGVLVEVTLSGGQRQADKETEPVWRHVGNFQESNGKKKSYGLFIAPDINEATFLDFFVRATHPLFKGKKVIVIPLSLTQFIEVFRHLSGARGNKSLFFTMLLSKIEEEANSGKYEDGVTWSRTIPTIIAEWKEIVA